LLSCGEFSMPKLLIVPSTLAIIVVFIMYIIYNK
jgi:hypothetical protein